MGIESNGAYFKLELIKQISQQESDMIQFGYTTEQTVNSPSPQTSPEPETTIYQAPKDSK